MKITIKGTEFPLKYTIESWKKLKSEKDITPINIQDKLNEDFADCISPIILYGLSVEDRKNIKIEDIDLEFGFEIIDTLLPAIMENMPQSVKDENAAQGGEPKK